LLEERIGLGGDVGQVVTLVNVYQRTDAVARAIAFREWLEGELFLCERCEHEFSGHGFDAEEDDQVLCSGCRRR
jgi:hypothetical protein